MVWGTLAARQMTQIGIEVAPSYLPFSAIYPRRNQGDIQGTDAVLPTLKAGEIDAHDPLYDVAPLASTIDLSWAKRARHDMAKAGYGA